MASHDNILSGAMWGQLDLVKLALDNGEDLHCNNDEPLQQSANIFFESVCYILALYKDQKGYDDAEKFLLLEAKEIFDKNFIPIEQEKKHLETTKFLISKGAKTQVGLEQLMECAVELNNYNVAEFLIKIGVDIHSGHERLLRCAAKNGNLEMVKFLVGNGANPKEPKCYAIEYAIDYDHNDIVDYLIKL